MTKSLKDFEIRAPEAGSDISCQAKKCKAPLTNLRSSAMMITESVTGGESPGALSTADSFLIGRKDKRGC